VRLGLGRHHQVQTLDELLFEDSDPVYFDPVQVDSVVLSYDHAWSPQLDSRIETYYRRYRNTQPRYENAFNPRVIIPELGVDRLRISPERATVKGLELSVSGRQEAWSWRANYSFSDAHDVVNGVEQPRTWDQHHSINLGAHWQGQRWSFGSQLSYHDGWPTTALEFDPQSGQIQRQPRNGERLKDYVNIDLKAERRFTLAGGEASWWIAVSNALGTDNVCCIEYELDEQDDGLFSLERREENWYPLFPSIGFQWRWTR
jgi:outer membrane cobalamin receptor